MGEAELPAGQHGHWKASLPGGILYDLAPHPAYLLQGFVGTIGDVHVVTRGGEDGKLREVRAVVDGARALGTLTISLESKPFMNRVTLYGTAMTAEANLNNMTLIVRRTRQVPKLIGKVLPNIDEAVQLLRATVQQRHRVRSRPAALLPRHGPPLPRVVRGVGKRSAAAGERRRRPRWRAAAGATVGARGRRGADAGATGGARMKALVTGANGFLGRSIVRRLLRDGVQVRALVRPGRTIDLAGVEVVEGDICDDAAIVAATPRSRLGDPCRGAGRNHRQLGRVRRGQRAGHATASSAARLRPTCSASCTSAR